MLSYIIGYIPETKGGPPLSVKKRIATAMVFLNWLKKVIVRDLSIKVFFLRTWSSLLVLNFNEISEVWSPETPFKGWAAG
jgi:hypothetical protein